MSNAPSPIWNPDASPPKLVAGRWYYDRCWRTRESLIAGGWVLPVATKLELMLAAARSVAERRAIRRKFGTRAERVPVAPRIIAELEVQSRTADVG